MNAKRPITAQELAHWRAILLQLKPRTLEIFLLIAVDRFNSQQAASRLGVPAFWVRRHLLKAIEHIDQNPYVA